jgi:hypothetical protein
MAEHPKFTAVGKKEIELTFSTEQGALEQPFSVGVGNAGVFLRKLDCHSNGKV